MKYIKFILLLIIIFILSIFIFKKDIKEESIFPIATTTPEVSLQEILVYPDKIFPGDPILVTINASSSIEKVFFDTKVIPTFNFNSKPRALIAIPFEEKIFEHKVKVELTNGMILEKNILLTPREKIEKPLGIPEKLGGNTKEAGKTLVNNLAKENQSINNIKTSPTILWSEKFINPLDSMFVTDDYGYNRDTVGFVIVHKGTDFRAGIGTEVVAMNKGIVRIAREYTVYGKSIVIDHGLGLSTLYMHLSELKVKEGDEVEAGQIIGLSGKTGYAESPHLHISVKVNGVSIDPIKFLEIFNMI